jgi:hypothetical protein
MVLILNLLTLLLSLLLLLSLPGATGSAPQVSSVPSWHIRPALELEYF